MLINLIHFNMKNIYLPFLLIIIACSSSDQSDNSITGKWELTSLTAGFSNNTMDADQLEYQEYYEFFDSGKFRKYRSTGQEASGSYEKEILSDGEYYKLVYNEGESHLKESCGENEFLKLENGTLNGGSLPCDGPGLTYSKFQDVEK